MSNIDLSHLLVPSAKRTTWRMNDHSGEADAAFARVRGGLLEAYDFTCAFCQQRAEKWQEVHHANEDHSDNQPRNLICACPLCHQVFHVGLAGMRDGGDLIYAPELTQAEINQLMLVIWLVTEVDTSFIRDHDQEASSVLGKLQGRAASLRGVFENRRGTVYLRLKAGLKDAGMPAELLDKMKMAHISLSLLATALMALPDAAYEQRDQLLGGLRILPKPARFRKQLEFYGEQQRLVLSPGSWGKILAEQDVDSIVMLCKEQLTRLTQPASSAG